jgi:hypothetical protein
MCHAVVVVVTAQRIAPDAHPALSDALSVSYWRKQHLQRFLQTELASAASRSTAHCPSPPTIT